VFDLSDCSKIWQSLFGNLSFLKLVYQYSNTNLKFGYQPFSENFKQTRIVIFYLGLFWFSGLRFAGLLLYFIRFCILFIARFVFEYELFSEVC